MTEFAGSAEMGSDGQDDRMKGEAAWRRTMFRDAMQMGRRLAVQGVKEN